MGILAILNRGKLISIFVMVFLIAAMFSSCYYDQADIVYPPAATCDSANAKYSTTVVPILTSNCYSCHSGTAISGGGIKLDNYASLLIQVNNGKLIGAIEHKNGYSAMPKGGGQLPACDISKIRVWISSGAPNN